MKILIEELNEMNPYACGIYFLYKKDKLIYIGKTTYAGSRLTEIRFMNDFLKFGIPTHIIFIELCDEENDLLDLEKKLIKFFKPLANFMHLQKELREVYVKNREWTTSF